MNVAKKLINKYKALPVQVKASIWFLVCAFFQKGISFITTPIFTRLLTTAEYGQYSVFLSWQSILTVFITLNISSGVYVQGLVKFEEDRRAFTSSLLGLTTTMVVAWGFVYWIFHEIFNRILSLNTLQMIAMLIIIWASAMFSFWSVDQRVDFKYGKLLVLTIVVSIINPAIGIILVSIADDNVSARIFGIAVVELIAYVGLFFSQMRKGKKFFSKKYWPYVLRFNISLLPHYLSTSVLSGADRIMIDNMVGSSEAGIYSLAYSVSMIMTMVNAALLRTIEPWLYKKIKKNRLEDISKVAYPCLLIIAVMNLLLMAFAPEIIAVFAPADYYNAIWVIPPVSMSTYFMFAYSFFATFEFYFEKTKFISIATVLGAILNIALNYIFIKAFGYYAAGYTTLFCYIIYAVCHYLFMRRICHKELNGMMVYDVRVLIAISTGFVLFGFIFLCTYNYQILRYCLLLIMLLLVILKRELIVSTVKAIAGIEQDKVGAGEKGA